MVRFRRRRRAAHRGGREEVLAAANDLAAAGRFEDAIQLLTDSNRRSRDHSLEARLVDLRHRAFGATTWPSVSPAWPDVPDRFPDARVPETTAAEFDVDCLRSAVQHHGSLIVRRLLGPDRVSMLVRDIDAALAAYDARAEVDGAAAGVEGWYQEFAGDAVSDRERKRFRGSIMTVESPPTLFDLMETFDATGVRSLVCEYFGEPPALLARKGTLRRISREGRTGGWHQDGAFMGRDIRSLNIWIALTHCGDTAPGLDLVGRRLNEIVPTGAGASAAWATSPEAAEDVAAGAVVRPVFEPGDVLFFDHLNLHRTAIDPGMVSDRHAIETWLFAPSTYASMTAPIDGEYTPQDQIPVIF